MMKLWSGSALSIWMEFWEYAYSSEVHEEWCCVDSVELNPPNTKINLYQKNPHPKPQKMPKPPYYLGGCRELQKAAVAERKQ